MEMGRGPRHYKTGSAPTGNSKSPSFGVQYGAAKNPDRKGWAHRNTEMEIQRLRAERESRVYEETRSGALVEVPAPVTPAPEGFVASRVQVDSDGNPVMLEAHFCDHCLVDDHENCYRIVCNCPCYWEFAEKERKMSWAFNLP